ncbi:MAG TPA: hemerythrin domain-containing protein [Ktedonobacterales bacterium]|nr:hemerythrin domain-containing protein [Ktedonobacterales bacterium]
MDLLTQLSHEHKDLRAILEDIEAAAESRDATTLAANLEAARAALTQDLDTHIAVEEADAFVPIAGGLGKDLLTPFYEEHVEIRNLRDDIYARLARGEQPYEPCLRLCELILAHQQREDLMLFPSARETVFRLE